MKHEEEQYLDLCRHILDNGTLKEDRTGTGTKSVFGYQMRFDLSKAFPLLTTKRLPFRIIAEELFWFLDGCTNIRPLLEKKVHIWTEWPFETWFTSEEYDGELSREDWKNRYINEPAFTELIDVEKKRFESKILEDDAFAEKFGELGPVYGKQWRQWEGANGEQIDQISDLLKQIEVNPDSRRLIVSGWKVDEIPKMALPPCHSFFQFYVADNKLSCQLYQRSGDVFLGVGFNIASYALLTIMIAHVLDLEVGEFIHTLGDAHIYSNHIDQVNEQLTREPFPFPTLKINRKVDDIFDFSIEDFTLENYVHHKSIKAPIAI